MKTFEILITGRIEGDGKTPADIAEAESGVASGVVELGRELVAAIEEAGATVNTCNLRVEGAPGAHAATAEVIPLRIKEAPVHAEAEEASATGVTSDAGAAEAGAPSTESAPADG